MNRLALFTFALLSGATILGGCAANFGGTSVSADSFDRQSARILLSDARSAIARGNVVFAVPQLHELVARHPDTQEAIIAHYLLGKAYYELDDYRSALEHLSRYLDTDPTGKHAKESRTLMNRLAEEYRQRFPSDDTLDSEIDLLRERWEAEPGSIALGGKLADRLWLRGRYPEAADVYLTLLQGSPEFARDAAFSQRIDVQPDGGHVLLTPAEITRREVERRPVTVINLSSYRSGRDRRTQQQQHFMVTGQALNRSDGVLRGVEIDITVYGFGNRIYDTRSQRIGDMRPGETRAFSVRFANFRELNSIDRYDYSVRFVR